MFDVLKRPVGIAAITTLLVINGVIAILGAFGLAGLTYVGPLNTIFLISVGFALLYRAYSIWNFRHGAWLVTVLLITWRGVLAMFLIILATPAVADWINFGLIVLSLAYLTQPEIRELFAKEPST